MIVVLALDNEPASYGIDQISQKHDLIYEIFFYNSRFFHEIYRIKATVIQWVHISSFCKLIEIPVSYKILRTPA